MLRLPDDPTNPLKLADWLELLALLAPDGNASRGDLERSLQRATLYELRDDQAIELKTLEVFDELEQRLKAAEAAYPFSIDYGTLQLRSAWRQFPAYIFCLCLSYFGARNSEPRKLFEIISSVAAKAFLYGDAIDFGFPRRTLPSSFAEAVSELCRLIGEGGRFTQLPTLGQKDAKLDLVAWRDFPDRSSNKLLLLGQCASGTDWEGKLRELNPRAFFANWAQDTPSSPLISSVFIPHRIERQKWNNIARIAEAIIFDRCRIAYWAHGASFDYEEPIAWVDNVFQEFG